MITQSRVTAQSALQEQASVREIWGVIGGMGPLASAEFIRTIYEMRPGHREQDMPGVILVSDPTMPDRTECFRKGCIHILAQKLETSIRQLGSLGVTNIVVCCLTIHHVLHSLPANLQQKVFSLVQVIHSAVIRRRRMHLLLCTSGARDMRLFESHPLWKHASNYVVMPSVSDQDAIHQLIYRIKRNLQTDKDLAPLENLAARYKAEALIAGCTDLHLIAKKTRSLSNHGIQWLDPLQIAASRIVDGLPGKTGKCPE